MKKETFKHNAASDMILEAESSASEPEKDREYPFHVVLVEPEIPANTGNISRTCALTGCKLHLVKPLGFSIDDRMLKRAGLDYWDHLNIEVHESLEEFLEEYRGEKMYYASTHAVKNYADVEYEPGSFILFGKETAGLPREMVTSHPETAVRVPMGNDPDLRSLNLSNSVAIVLYEALRQTGFPGLI